MLAPSIAMTVKLQCNKYLNQKVINAYVQSKLKILLIKLYILEEKQKNK